MHGRGHSSRRGPGPDGPGPALRRLAEGAASRYRVRQRLANCRQRPHRRVPPGHRRERHVPGPPEAPAPPEAFPDGLAGGEVRAALAALLPGMRASVVLRHWLDLSVEEAAELLNCSEGTVKSQTAKAAARPRDLLSHAAVERTRPAGAAPASSGQPHTVALVTWEGTQPPGCRGRHVRRTGRHPDPHLRDRRRAVVVIQGPVSLGWDSAELASSLAACRCWSLRSRGAAEPACRYDGCRRVPHGGSRPRVQVGYGVGRPR